MTNNNLKQTIIENLYWNPHASMEEIAKQASISKATLHRHFKGREGMMWDLFNFSIQQLSTVLENQTESLDGTLEKLIEMGSYVSFLYLYPYDGTRTDLESTIRQSLKHYYERIETSMIRPSYEDHTIRMNVLHSSVMTLWGQIRLGNLLKRDAVKIVKELYFND